MKRFEVVSVGFIILWLLIQLIPDQPEAFVLSLLASWVLALYYLIGGYWIFNSANIKRIFVPIAAGIAFAASLISFPFLIKVHRTAFFTTLPFFNILLFCGLSIWYINIKSEETLKYIRGLMIRSFIIMIVVGFFTYTPSSFKPYREVLKVLNQDNISLVSNLQMLDYVEEYTRAIAAGNCEQAAVYAEKANQAGLKWLSIKSVDQDNYPVSTSDEYDIWKISDTYEMLYEAYKCKADHFFEHSKFEQAISYYSKANRLLYRVKLDSYNLQKRRSSILNSIELCNKALGNSTANTLFAEDVE